MNRQEFTRRVLALEDRLYRISYGLLRAEQDRMDAVQESILKAWKNLPGLRSEAYFETWLTRILIRECYNILNARKRFVSMDELPEPIQPPQGANAQLHDAVMALERSLRLPVILYYMEGYKLREVAGILNLPEGTVKSRLKRARMRLRDMLMDQEVDPI